jgi:hypothetical protein
MSVIIRPEVIHLIITGVYEIPNDIRNLIVSFVLGLNTLSSFELSYYNNDYNGPSVHWEGKYTNGYIHGRSTVLSFDGEFKTKEVVSLLILPLIILSIQCKSIHACSALMGFMYNRGNQDHVDILNYINKKGEFAGVVVLGKVFLDDNQIESTIKELQLVWEMCINRGLTYINNILCTGNSIIMPYVSPPTFKIFGSDSPTPCIKWTGKYSHGYVSTSTIQISTNVEYFLFKAILPALILAIRYVSTSGCGFSYKSKDLETSDRWKSCCIGSFKSKSLSDLRCILGDVVFNSDSMALILSELTMLWDVCMSEGFYYKDGCLCMV